MKPNITVQNINGCLTWLRKQNAEIREETAKEIGRYAIKMQNEMKKNLKDNGTWVTGRLANSINHLIDANKLSGIVYVNANYAMAVEEGARAHWAPIRPLLVWAARKSGQRIKDSWGLAKAVQKKIAEDGTRAQPFAEPAREKIFPEYYEALKQRTKDVTRRFAAK